MIFIPYLFKKDLNRLKIIFIAWLLLILAQLALGVGGDRLVAEFLEFQMIVPLFMRLIGFLQCLMIIVIVPLIIQDDSLVGTTAFWLTRPISQKGLLFTKACMILLALIATQLIAEMLVLAAQGATAWLLLLAAPEILIEKLAFIIPFVILAAITPRFSRYALIGIIAFAAIVVALIIWSISVMLITKYFPHFGKYLHNYELYKNPSLAASFKVADNVYTIITGLILISYQFLKRNTVKTICWFVVAFLIMLGFTRVWRWDFLKQQSAVAGSPAVSGTLSVGFDANYVSVFDEPHFGKKTARIKSISIRETVEGLPVGEFATLDKIKDVKIKYPDGNSLKSEVVTTNNIRTYSDEQFMQPIQALLKDIKLLNPYKKEFSYTKIFSLGESDFHKFKNIKGDYSANADFEIYKYVLISRMPLKAGAKNSFGAEQAAIYDILENANTISVIINEKRINLAFDRSVKKRSMNELAQDMYSDYDHIYLLVNTKRRQAFLPEAGVDLFSGVMELYCPARLKTKAKKYDFTNLNSRNEPLPKIDKEWLADAELVRLGAVKVGTESVDFTVKGFSIPSQSTTTDKDTNEIEKRLKIQEQMREYRQK